MRVRGVLMAMLALCAAGSAAWAAGRTFGGKVRAEGENLKEWVGGGCSIYCALGEAVSVRASSSLPGAGYGAKAAHDFDLSTAWVEGAAGDGAGEWIEYTVDLRDKKQFGGTKLALTELRVFNGYRKSRDLWAKNGRVKSMDLSVDGRPYGRVALRDAYAWQFVDIGSVPLPPGKRTVLRFTLRETYPGTRYRDTALTDLGFEGTGHH